MNIRRPKKSYRKNAWIDSRLEICPSPLGGKGTYARQPIREGEIVTIWGADVFTEEEVNEGKNQGRSVMPIGDGFYRKPSQVSGNTPSMPDRVGWRYAAVRLHPAAGYTA
jgi:hypothetical protein